jgi:hypothetical protein
MSPLEIQQLKALIVATAMYYGHALPDQVLALYLEDLADLPFAAVVDAIKEARRDPKTTRFPLPAVIRAKIAPVESDDDLAIEAVSRVVAAVSRYGWCNSERARDFVGELGWRVVEMEGGWKTVCETLTQDNIGTLRAQWRNLARSSITRGKAGTLDVAPRLPEPKRGGELIRLGESMRKLTKEM